MRNLIRRHQSGGVFLPQPGLAGPASATAAGKPPWPCRCLGLHQGLRRMPGLRYGRVACHPAAAEWWAGARPTGRP